MLRGEIILENGDRRTFTLDDREIRKLDDRVKRMNEYLRDREEPEDWNMADELRSMMGTALDDAPDPAENETPGAATPGESR